MDIAGGRAGGVTGLAGGKGGGRGKTALQEAAARGSGIPGGPGRGPTFARLPPCHDGRTP